MKRVFLIGYMGAGKTTIGKMLAKKMNLDFIDLDIYIESRYRKSINQIFSEFGENRFREIEKSILEEVSGFEDVVISTGGGTPCFFDNIGGMNQKGLTVYLKSPINILASRLHKLKDKRPLIKNKQKDELLEFISLNMEKREPYYLQAQIIYNTDDLNSTEDLENISNDLMNIINHN
ncbi:MAG: shikimate kinase [Dysgonomonas sp.]